VYKGREYELPIITGNAFKNYHSRAMLQAYIMEGGRQVHKEHFSDMYRISKKIAQSEGLKNKEEKEVEEALVRNCAICDLHGFLLAEQNYPQARRESLIKMSHIIPAEEFCELKTNFTLTHNRVTAESAEMMLFRREYASSIYAFESLINLAQIGRSSYEKEDNKDVWLGKKILNDKEEVKRRIRSAVLAYMYAITGELGANTSRSLPLFTPLELVIILTKNPIPRPVHPFFKDYKETLTELIKAYREEIEVVAYFPEGAFSLPEEDKIKKYKTWFKVFEDVADRAVSLTEEVWK